MRKIRILESGIQYLKESSKFYNQIPEGIGAYFIETVFAEIDSLSIHSGIHLR